MKDETALHIHQNGTKNTNSPSKGIHTTSHLPHNNSSTNLQPIQKSEHRG